MLHKKSGKMKKNELKITKAEISNSVFWRFGQENQRLVFGVSLKKIIFIKRI